MSENGNDQGAEIVRQRHLIREAITARGGTLSDFEPGGSSRPDQAEHAVLWVDEGGELVSSWAAIAGRGTVTLYWDCHESAHHYGQGPELSGATQVRKIHAERARVARGYYQAEQQRRATL